MLLQDFFFLESSEKRIIIIIIIIIILILILILILIILITITILLIILILISLILIIITINIILLSFLHRACVQWNTQPFTVRSGRTSQRQFHIAFSKSIMTWLTSGFCGTRPRIVLMT